MHDVNDMRQHVIGALDGVDQGISGNAIDQCHRRIHVYARAIEHFEYSLLTQIS